MTSLLPPGRSIAVLDVLAVVWMLVWIVLGVRVYNEVQGLEQLAGTVVSAGEGVERVGQALSGLDLPVIGGRVEGAAREAREAGAESRRGGESARQSISSLKTLLGVAVALIPSSPLALFYLPARIAHVRERRAFRRLVREAADDPLLDRVLAHRGLHRMSYEELRALGDRPWAELQAGHYERLAAAETRRHGTRGG